MFTFFWIFALPYLIAPLGRCHKVGLLVNSAEPDETAAIIAHATFMEGTLDGLSSPLQLEIVHHDMTYLSVVRGVCELLN